MDPWSIIGWALVVLLALAMLLFISFVWEERLLPFLRARYQHLRTRRTPPSSGQTWAQGRSFLNIHRIAENGRIVIHSGNASWSDSPTEWAERVKGRKLWLVESKETV